mmetsp:Transcript_20144/g.43442  ORF Transcript_20144/g.43442 Transcript_20144/m.43442 type:complete len:348 (+) Transcript_20144:69-1112(+)
MSSDKKPIVLITGVTGYIGSHVCRLFLEKSDQYQVRGSVRNVTSAKSLATLQEALGEELLAKLELVPLELTNPDQFAEAVKGVQYVVHVASPFPAVNPKDENLVIQPALEGTLNMLKAASKEASVQRVCVTSSNYASFLMDLEDKANYPKLVDERCWSDETLPYLDPYQKSKIIAEKAAWKYYEEEKPSYTLTTVLPGYVMGPPLASKMTGNSIGFGIGVLTGESKIFPRMGFPLSDVRDVAQAHVNAVEKDDAQGLRFCLSSESQRLSDLAQHLKTAVGDAYDISTQEMDEESGKQAVGPFWDLFPVYNTERSVKVLGMEYTPVSKTMADMATALIEKGYVEDKRN